jgi:hypothetical protein
VCVWGVLLLVTSAKCGVRAGGPGPRARGAWASGGLLLAARALGARVRKGPDRGSAPVAALVDLLNQQVQHRPATRASDQALAIIRLTYDITTIWPSLRPLPPPPRLRLLLGSAG